MLLKLQSTSVSLSGNNIKSTRYCCYYHSEIRIVQKDNPQRYRLPRGATKQHIDLEQQGQMNRRKNLHLKRQFSGMGI